MMGSTREAIGRFRIVKHLGGLTAIFLGGSLVASESGRKSHFVHLVLTLAFAGWQGYILFLTGREMGLIQLIKSRLGG